MTLPHHRPITMTNTALYCACGERFRFKEDEMKGRTNEQLRDLLLDRFNDHKAHRRQKEGSEDQN